MIVGGGFYNRLILIENDVLCRKQACKIHLIKVCMIGAGGLNYRLILIENDVLQGHLIKILIIVVGA